MIRNAENNSGEEIVESFRQELEKYVNSPDNWNIVVAPGSRAYKHKVLSLELGQQNMLNNILHSIIRVTPEVIEEYWKFYT